MVERIGWDGVELPVRDRSTHIVLDRVEEDLPKMHEALAKRGKKIHLITTSINSVTPENERVLRAAASLGIDKYRLSYFRYDLANQAKHPMEQLAAFKPQLKELAALNRELGITILLVEQNARMALQAAAYGYIMEQGKIVLDGTSAALADNEDVKEFYLGQGGETRRSFKNIKSYKRRKRWL